MFLMLALWCFMGLVGTINRIYHSEKWAGYKHLWYADDKFCYTRYLEEYRGFMLNDDANLMSLWEVRKLAACSNSEEEFLFIKPNADLKEFTGEIVSTKNHYHKEAGDLPWDKNGGEILSADTQVIVSSPKNIQAEWRCFIVDGKVSSCSMYRCAGQPKRSLGCPSPEVVKFAEKMAVSTLLFSCSLWTFA